MTSSAVEATPDTPRAASEGASAGGPIVFYDGVCGLCNAAVDFILKHDRRGVIRLAPLQGATAASMLPADDIASLKTLVLIDERGIYRRSTAVCRILLRMQGWEWALGGLLWLVPWPLRDLGYRVVSRLRYRLFGKKETCRLPTAAERARFLP